MRLLDQVRYVIRKKHYYINQLLYRKGLTHEVYVYNN